MTSVQAIQAAVMREFGIAETQFFGDRRSRAIAEPRQIAMALAAEMTGFSHAALGRLFRRDRSTVVYAVREVERRAAADPALTRRIATLKARIETTPADEPAAAELALSCFDRLAAEARREVERDPLGFLMFGLHGSAGQSSAGQKGERP